MIWNDMTWNDMMFNSCALGAVSVFMTSYNYKSGGKRLSTLGHWDQYVAQHGPIVKQSYCETV